MKNKLVSQIDHLSYLKAAPSIFEDEFDEKAGQVKLVCAECGHSVTPVSEKIEVFGRHDHAFRLYGDIVHLGCFRNADGCTGARGVSNGYSWFKNYSWQIQICRGCFTQLGWKYMNSEESFYGLLFETLREEDKREFNDE